MQLVTDSVNKTQVSHSQPHHTIELERISGWFPGIVIIEHFISAIWKLVHGFLNHHTLSVAPFHDVFLVLLDACRHDLVSFLSHLADVVLSTEDNFHNTNWMRPKVLRDSWLIQYDGVSRSGKTTGISSILLVLDIMDWLDDNQLIDAPVFVLYSLDANHTIGAAQPRSIKFKLEC